MTAAPSVRRRPLGRALSVLLWWVLPGIVLLGVMAYFLGVVVDHTNPPIVAVQGSSMRPTLVTGDLVVLEGVNPASLRKGDIIAVTVAPAYRQRYHLPAHVVHRIVRIQHTKQGLVFTTKGDNNHSRDIFRTPASNIVGEVKYTVPDAGYVFLFFGSRQGYIFVASLGGILVVYFALGLWEDRRAYLEGVTATMETLRNETDELRSALTGAQPLFPGVLPIPGGGSRGLGPDPLVASIEDLATEVRASGEHSRDSASILRELVGAVSEYGVHLRSHTAVMQNLAMTTDDLKLAAGRLAVAVSGRSGGRGELPRDTVTTAGRVGEMSRRAARALGALDQGRELLRADVDRLELRLQAVAQHGTGIVEGGPLSPWDDDAARLRRVTSWVLDDARQRARALVHEIDSERRLVLDLMRVLGPPSAMSPGSERPSNATDEGEARA